MDVKFGWPQYMPSPYSVYVSKFSDETLIYLKNSDVLARYHKQDQEYEITPEVYEIIKKNEPQVTELNQLPQGKLYEEFVYHNDYDYQYQDDAVVFMRGKKNGLINFSQGCGKSLTTMKILVDQGCKRILIITGVSNLQEEWLKDARKHKVADGRSYAEYLNMRIVAGDPAAPVPKRIKYLQEQHKNEELFTDLIGIESCRSVQLTDAINALHYDAVVVDEVQSAKGMNAEQTQGLHDIKATDDQLRLALSGTPALNDPLEYYSVLRFLRVLYYKSQKEQCSRSAFNKYYGNWGFDYFGHYVCKGYRNLEQLKQLIAPVLITAPKSLLNLPPKHREVVQLTMQNPAYAELAKLYRKGSKAVLKAGYKTIQALGSKLQLMTCTDQSKLDLVKHHIQLGHRPLVFSRFTEVLDVVKARMEEQGFSVAYYHGKLSSKERLRVLDKWKGGEGDVLLLSINTARYGLNLQETQVSMFLEPPTSPAILDQAEDRLHRIGQTKDVYSYIMLAGESDSDAYDNLRLKQDALNFMKD
ncbi:MAG: DEAD/DEAH box helicase [Acetobacter sp.]|nr:DEAD/DEAH box helicase [Acetobacter sp.]